MEDKCRCSEALASIRSRSGAQWTSLNDESSQPGPGDVVFAPGDVVFAPGDVVFAPGDVVFATGWVSPCPDDRHDRPSRQREDTTGTTGNPTITDSLEKLVLVCLIIDPSTKPGLVYKQFRN